MSTFYFVALRKIKSWKSTPSKKQQKPFINPADQTLKKKKDNPEADTSDLEKQIDGMVYGLYNLTEKEIGIVENK